LRISDKQSGAASLSGDPPRAATGRHPSRAIDKRKHIYENDAKGNCFLQCVKQAGVLNLTSFSKNSASGKAATKNAYDGSRLLSAITSEEVKDGLAFGLRNLAGYDSQPAESRALTRSNF